MSRTFFKPFGRAGLTLVEVIAGLALLATLLASILVSFGAHIAQIRAARDRLAAVDAADRLLKEWTSKDAFPMVGTTQGVPGSDVLSWRLVANDSGEIRQAGWGSVRLEVFRSDKGITAKALASVELLVSGNATASK